MDMIVTSSYEGFSNKAADFVSAQIVLKPDCLLGLATGTTPVGLYAALAQRYQAGDLNFSRVRTVNLDEYCGLPPESEHSYHHFMHTHLFSKVNIPLKNTRLPDGMAADVVREGRAYDAYIIGQGGIDLQVLGIGHNGHIGFNEPSEAFTADTHCVTLAESTIQANARLFSSIEEVPRQAITMGMRSILQAKRILLLASGDSKKDILQQALLGPVTPKCPASILQLHPDVTVIADFSLF